MSLRVRQALVIVVGVVVAGVMVWLGLWQLQVFTDQGNASIAARAEQPAVPVLEHVGPDGTVGDIYGKPVTASGHYLGNTSWCSVRTGWSGCSPPSSSTTDASCRWSAERSHPVPNRRPNRPGLSGRRGCSFPRKPPRITL